MSAVRCVFASILLAAAAPPALAAAQDQASQAGQACVPIEEASARLACYDRAFGRAVASAGSAATAAGGRADAASAAAAAGVSPEAARAVDEFGLSEEAKRKRDPEKARETMPESISGTVAKISWRPTGEVVVTLDNGQVWEQAETVTTKARVKVGDAVTIRKAALGSFTMVTPNRTAIRMRRVR